MQKSPRVALILFCLAGVTAPVFTGCGGDEDSGTDGSSGAGGSGAGAGGSSTGGASTGGSSTGGASTGGNSTGGTATGGNAGSDPGGSGGDGGAGGSGGSADLDGGVEAGDPDSGPDAAPIPACGDGNLDDGETCDDGNTSNTDQCPETCVTAFCGDGFILTGTEECDDHDIDSNDGCSGTCTHEADACDTCKADNPDCATAITACFDATDLAAAGPAQGTSRGILCENAFWCAKQSMCYATDAADCYCSAEQTLQECLTGTPLGPCVTEFQAAGESTAGSDIESRLSDASYALGRAGGIMLCEQFLCTETCIP